MASFTEPLNFGSRPFSSSWNAPMRSAGRSDSRRRCSRARRIPAGARDWSTSPIPNGSTCPRPARRPRGQALRRRHRREGRGGNRRAPAPAARARDRRAAGTVPRPQRGPPMKTRCAASVGWIAAATILAGIAHSQTTLVDASAVYPEGPLWRDGKLLYVEYAGPGVKTWDGKRTTSFWSGAHCGASGLIAYRHNHILVACYDSNTIVELD